MCIECEYGVPLDDEYEPEDEDFLDEDWEPLSRATAPQPVANSSLSLSDKMEFISLLLADDSGAIITVEAFLEALREPVVTEVFHTLWNGQETTDGFHVYHVNHGLDSNEVLVSLDTNELFTYSVKDANTVVVVCPEPLFGVDVEVRLK